MKLLTSSLVLLLLVVLSGSQYASAQEPTDTIPIANSSTIEKATYNQETYTATTPIYSPTEMNAQNIWKYNKKFMVGYTTGTLDRKSRFGGEISSRWGLSMTIGRNIHFHRKPIACLLKIGMNLDFEVNYMNFVKGSGNLSDLLNPDNYDDMELPTLGQHYVTAGIGIGPTATVAPFHAFSDGDLAALRFRPYFRVTPSFASYIVSDDDDIEMHNAFALWYSAGMEIQWKHLIVGLGWKWSSAMYKDLVDGILDQFEEEGHSSGDSYKFDARMFNIMIGVAF